MSDHALPSPASPDPGEWAVILVDQHGTIRNCSPGLLGLIDHDLDTLRGRPLSDLLPALPIRPQTPGYNCAFATFWQKRRGLRQRLSLRADRQMGNLETRLCPIPGTDRASPAMILVGLRFPRGAMAQDADLDRLRQQAERSPQSVMMTDPQGVITYVNPVFERITGYTRGEAVGRPASLIKSGLHTPSFYQQLWSALEDGREFQAVFANRRKNGEIFFEEKRIRPFVDHAGQPGTFIAIGSPVNEFLQSTFQRFEHLANHDPLTGLPNRHLFLDRLAQHCARASRNGMRFAVAYLDLDNFKQINDRFGHAAGDRVLQATAEHLSATLRDEDTIARLGGDEFGLILSDMKGEPDVVRIIGKVLQSLRGGARFGEQTLPISASIGIALYPEAGTDPESMLHQADHIMYQCKRAGGQGFRLYHTGDEAVVAAQETAARADLFGEQPAATLDPE